MSILFGTNFKKCDDFLRFCLNFIDFYHKIGYTNPSHYTVKVVIS